MSGPLFVTVTSATGPSRTVAVDELLDELRSVVALPTVAVFTIDDRYLATGPRQNSIAGTSVYVTLKCDFILDCHGNPVSGPHLRGRLPSGNGRPGGTFESWFRVVSGGYGEKED